jgi:uncharacterized protein YkwD
MRSWAAASGTTFQHTARFGGTVHRTRNRSTDPSGARRDRMALRTPRPTISFLVCWPCGKFCYSMGGREAICAGVAAASLLLLAATPALASPCPHGDDVATALSPADRRAALMCVIAVERGARGLPAVRESAQLTLAAQRHADDMVARSFFDHVTPGGTTLAERVLATGYIRNRPRWELGEAIAWAQDPLDTAAQLVQAWLNSPPHRGILLDPTFRDVGVGVTPGLTDGSGGAGATAVLDFGLRSSSTLTPWRSRSATACAQTARRSPRARARCASTSTRSTRSSRARHHSSTRGATT